MNIIGLMSGAFLRGFNSLKVRLNDGSLKSEHLIKQVSIP